MYTFLFLFLWNNLSVFIFTFRFSGSYFVLLLYLILRCRSQRRLYYYWTAVVVVVLSIGRIHPSRHEAVHSPPRRRRVRPRTRPPGTRARPFFSALDWSGTGRERGGYNTGPTRVGQSTARRSGRYVISATSLVGSISSWWLTNSRTRR